LIVIIGIASAVKLGNLSARFEEWQKKNNKSYATSEEKAQRFKNFISSVIRIEKKNANQTYGANYGLNQFSDMTPEEFRSTMLMKNKITPKHQPKVEVARQQWATAAPANFDWRQASNTPITPVKDQQQCGSCWAFSVGETAESANILGGKGNANTMLVSEQQIVDCDTSDDGCNGGNPETAWQYIISTQGLDSESSYPYTAEDGTCKFKAQNVIATVKGWKYATTSGDETTLQSNLLKQPVSICVDAANWQDYQSGVMTAWECAWVVQLDHCVQLVGYSTGGTNGNYWIVRNSWNTNWGIDGYIWLEMGADTCGLTQEATIPQV